MDNNLMHHEFFESDDEEDENLVVLLIRKPYTIRERPDFFNMYDENEFLSRFRLSKVTALRVLALIEENIRTRIIRNHAVTPLHQLLLTLRFYATGTFHMAIADFAGIHRSTVCRIIKKVTLAVASLRERYITIPQDDQTVRATQIGFYNLAKFPRVIGAIDCTHVKIQSPGNENAEVFRNRKGVFTMNVQAVCDSRLRFTDIVARWPGSTHDSTIFNASRIRARFVNEEMGNSLLLGDSGYACSHFLMTPLLQTQTRAEELYNESQIRSRNTIERAFGIWKRRFPVLALGMRLHVLTVQAVSVATAVLHNIAREMNDPEPRVVRDIEDQMIALEVDEIDEAIPPNHNGFNKRRAFIDTYFARLLR